MHSKSDLVATTGVHDGAIRPSESPRTSKYEHRARGGDDASLMRGGRFYKAQQATRLIDSNRWNLGRRITFAIAVEWAPLKSTSLSAGWAISRQLSRHCMEESASRLLCNCRRLNPSFPVRRGPGVFRVDNCNRGVGFVVPGRSDQRLAS